jgi:amidophosphoribosyltransferase
MIAMTKDAPYSVRDLLGSASAMSRGFINNNHYVLASESCALDHIGARFLRELEPGEIVTITDNSLQSC